MTPMDWGIAAAALLLIAFVNWFFFAPRKATTAAATDGIVDVTVACRRRLLAIDDRGAGGIARSDDARSA